ncbi:hypothetical protein N7925_04040 [Streptomyces sp. CA-278952]|uniref:hypothetical protein n=1 Tax=Streptomyces sp. CA-278952 TaxID=2980556 RepID=UPI00236842C2|nr:hypothetical protein [Streptomyces sp. CA-278952]WDG27566.1 hypothetical protein N7925_04040 [Streptomyces sp. CA-278952]
MRPTARGVPPSLRAAARNRADRCTHQVVLLRTAPDPQLPAQAATTTARAAAAGGAFDRPALEGVASSDPVGNTN